MGFPFGTLQPAPPAPSLRHAGFVQAHGDLKSFETPYVVRLYKHMQIAKAKPCFTFVHPNKDATIDNTRWVHVCVPGAGTLSQAERPLWRPRVPAFVGMDSTFHPLPPPPHTHTHTPTRAHSSAFPQSNPVPFSLAASGT
jgi:hypothetical protein